MTTLRVEGGLAPLLAAAIAAEFGETVAVRRRVGGPGARWLLVEEGPADRVVRPR